MTTDFRVIFVAVGKPPEVRTVEELDLETLRGFVAGDIEILTVGRDDEHLYINEEGRINGLPLNRYVTDDSGNVWDILGDFVLLAPGDEEGNETSLTDAQIEKWLPRLEGGR